MSKIKQLKPSDQSQSSDYYEFQHAETMRGCLRMLKEENFNSVFCEWHDDFVEVRTRNDQEFYTFCQVKGKKLNLAKFSFETMFGLRFSKKIAKPKKVPKKVNSLNSGSIKNTKPSTGHTVDHDSILYKQFVLFLKFGEDSESFKVLSNFEFGENVVGFLDYLKAGLKDNPVYENNLKLLYDGYLENLKDDYTFTLPDLRKFFSMVELVPGCNLLDDFKDKLFSEISEYLDLIREIPINRRNILRMIDDLLRLIKTKADEKLEKIPDQTELINLKAILVTDVLEYIGVSRDLFVKLGDGAISKIKHARTASRLERILKSNQEEQIQNALTWKSEWDLWYQKHKGAIRALDHMKIKRIFSSEIPDRIDDIDLEQTVNKLLIKFTEENFKLDPSPSRHEDLVIGGFLATVIEFEAPLND